MEIRRMGDIKLTFSIIQSFSNSFHLVTQLFEPAGIEPDKNKKQKGKRPQ